MIVIVNLRESASPDFGTLFWNFHRDRELPVPKSTVVSTDVAQEIGVAGKRLQYYFVYTK